MSGAPDEYLVVPSGGAMNRVEAWSRERLPFEPRGALREFRSELAQAVEGLRADSGRLLHGIYAAAQAEAVDTENVLFYNVSPGRFARAAMAGIRFERAYTVPACPVGEGFRHYHRYEVVEGARGFLGWEPGAPLGTYTAAETGSISESTRPSVIWHALKAGRFTPGPGSVSAGSAFGLRVILMVPPGERVNVAAVMKPVLDGAVAAFTRHDGTDRAVIVFHLAAQLHRDEDSIEEFLLEDRGAVLGSRRLLWPRAGAVQWNPGDDHCVACEVIREDRGAWGLTAEAFAVGAIEPAGAGRGSLARSTPVGAIAPRASGKAGEERGMSFYVFEDRGRASGPKIHAESCHYYRNRKPGATTTIWHGPFAAHDQARGALAEVAAQQRMEGNPDPKCCRPATSPGV